VQDDLLECCDGHSYIFFKMKKNWSYST
jgi:hypothetical protein